MASRVPYFLGVRTAVEHLAPSHSYPFNLPFVANLDLEFSHPVAFFVGENGSGKSTLIEAIAELCRLPVSGGGRNELADTHGPERTAALSGALRPVFRKRPPDGYFLRAEFHDRFASLLDARKLDPDFGGDPYARYGGRSLHEQSHGESFLSVLRNRMRKGLFLLDEPESALSPQRQLALLVLMHELVETGACQFIVASHSPILMTYPMAQIISFDKGTLEGIALEDTTHYQITRGILEDPQKYWKYLIE
jgi:predicted ATPase